MVVAKETSVRFCKISHVCKAQSCLFAAVPKGKNHGVSAASKFVEFAFNRTHMPRLRKKTVLCVCRFRVFLPAICHKFFACFFNANNRALLLFRQKKACGSCKFSKCKNVFQTIFSCKTSKKSCAVACARAKRCRFLIANSAKSNSVFKQNLLTKRGKHGSTNK